LIFRLLYRLLLQNLGRRSGPDTVEHETPTAVLPNASIDATSPAAPASSARRRLASLARFCLPALLLGTVGIIVYLALPDSFKPRALVQGDATANLQLSIGSSTTWPLVVYLSGDRLNLPEFDDAAIRSQKI